MVGNQTILTFQIFMGIRRLVAEGKKRGTGDEHIELENRALQFDGITVYEKWLKCHLDEQHQTVVFLQ
jgi:hypothetical protein